jgi:hypothetical protein
MKYLDQKMLSYVHFQYIGFTNCKYLQKLLSQMINESNNNNIIFGRKYDEQHTLSKMDL